MSNFKFLEKINKDLYNLGVTAEKLFRDEYFDQCITQTRKLAENMTKEVLGNKAQSDDTFDDMIYKLKTISRNTLKEQEFISDMYFLKKKGNIAVHSSKSDNSGKIALECLEHAFEAAVNFASSRTKEETINLLLFDENLLVLGEKNPNLQQEYKKKLQEQKKLPRKQNIGVHKIQTEKTSKNLSEKGPKQPQLSCKNVKRISLYAKTLIVSCTMSCLIILILMFLLNINSTESSYNAQFNKNKYADNFQKQNKESANYKLSKVFSQIR